MDLYGVNPSKQSLPADYLSQIKDLTHQSILAVNIPPDKNLCAKCFKALTTMAEQIYMKTFQKPFPCKFEILDSMM